MSGAAFLCGALLALPACVVLSLGSARPSCALALLLGLALLLTGAALGARAVRP